MRFVRLTPTLLLLAIASGAPRAWAQLRDSVRLDTVRLSAERTRPFGTGLSRQRFDAAMLARYAPMTLADVLAEQSAAVVRPYGPSGIAVMSLRGLTANYSGVVWGGLVLNSPTTGQADLHTLPMAALGSAELQLGGAAALYGSSVIGGSVIVGSGPAPTAPRVQLQGTVGAFGRTDGQLRVELPEGQGPSVQLGLWSHSATNDFAYDDRSQAGGNRRTRAHAATWGQGLTLNLGRRLGAIQLDGRLWAQQQHRQLPSPSTDTRPGTATLADAAIRLNVEAQRVGPRASSGVTALRVLIAREDQSYLAMPTAAASRTLVTSLVVEGEHRQPLGRHHRVGAGLQARHDAAAVTNYARPVAQARVEAFALWAWQQGRWSADAALRQAWDERAAERWLEPIPAVGLRYRAGRALHLRAHAARVYRLPTLNERYWSPGGRPDLRAERGVSRELGLDWHPGLLKGAAELALTGYDITLAEGVLWLPQPEGYWAPENRQGIRSLGLEARARWRRTRGDWSVDVSLSYTYTRAAITASADLRERWQQLFYQPLHAGAGALSIRYRRSTLALQQSGVGARAVGTTAEAPRLPGYAQASLHLSQGFTLGGVAVEALLRVHNLTDAALEPVAHQPLPGRHLSLTLSTRLNPLFPRSKK